MLRKKRFLLNREMTNLTAFQGAHEAGEKESLPRIHILDLVSVLVTHSQCIKHGVEPHPDGVEISKSSVA